jgi:GT2 family glycosyltransferase
MEREESLWVVIPVHNRLELTGTCLEALAAQTAGGFRTIVVDDGSTDGTSEMIAKRYPDVVVLRGDGSLWWSGSVNLGIQHALDHGAHAVLLLNDDTMPAPDLVEALNAAGAANPSALVGAVATDAEGVLVYGGEIVDWPTARFNSLLDILPADRLHGTHDVTHLPGRGLRIPAEVFAKVGLFDAKHFPQAIADYDFTQHALRAGHANLVCFDARLVALPEETANVKLRKSPSLAKYYEHLFGVRGAGNLPRYVRYAWRNCPPEHFVPFVALGIFRRVGGYLVQWARYSAADGKGAQA